VQRATQFEFVPGLSLRTCSAEDLIVRKLFAARAIDIRDAERIAVRHDKSLVPLVETTQDFEIMRQFTRL
jgi:hypothetical protein